MTKPKITAAELLSLYAPYYGPDVYIENDDNPDIIFHHDALSGRELPEVVGNKIVRTFSIRTRELWIYASEEDDV